MRLANPRNAGQEIYRFDGSDEHLLEKMAEAYDEVTLAFGKETNQNDVRGTVLS